MTQPAGGVVLSRFGVELAAALLGAVDLPGSTDDVDRGAHIVPGEVDDRHRADHLHQSGLGPPVR